MKNALKTLMVIALALTVVSQNAEAKKKSTKKAKTQHISMVGSSSAGTGKKLSPSSSGRPLSTDVVFDGSMVNGRYHTAGEAVTTVESEKKMNELVGFRRDFKDRLVVERARLRGQ